jgi:hypothetical protein
VVKQTKVRQAVIERVNRNSRNACASDNANHKAKGVAGESSAVELKLDCLVSGQILAVKTTFCQLNYQLITVSLWPAKTPVYSKVLERSPNG